MGSYLFRWSNAANDVRVTGTFEDWGEGIELDKVGTSWEKEVDLPSADEKVLYKFIVDGEWVVDEAAPKEGTGAFINNVLDPTHIKRKDVSQSKADEIPGAFPETPAQEVPSFGVAPIPASSGVGNPIKLPAGAPIPDQKDGVARDVSSTATTSKEDYEKAGSSAFPPPAKDNNEFSINPIPGTIGAGNPVSVPAGSALPDQKDVTSNTVDSTVTTSKEDYEKAGSSTAIPEPKAEEPTFGVQPIPATSGVGNPVSVPAGASPPAQKDITSNTIDSTVTTSKEDYEKGGSSTAVPGLKADEPAFGIQPIPVSSGISNPISLPAGAPIPDQKNITPHTVDSTVTTSKEDYENAGSSAFPAYTAAGVGAAGAALGGAALGGAFSTPKEKNNLVPESSLPMGVGKADTLDAGPFISSSGPGTTTADLASKVPLETNPIISSSGPGTTTAELAGKVPLEEGFSSSIGEDKRTAKLASELEVPLKHSPFISSSGPGTTTSQLASEAPLQNDPIIRSGGPGTTTSDLAAQVPLQNDPIVRSSGPGTTTDALAAGVPLEDKNVPKLVKESISTSHQDPEAVASPEAVKDKAELEKELLSKTEVSEATGEPASVATHQTSYYGLATTVPETVEKSMQQAHAAPEAAADSSIVAEKAAVEQELLRNIPSTEEAGEPAPTLAAATSPTAPTTTSTEAAATSITDGKTANQPVPDTDTSSAARGTSAGELAGGAAVGGAAAAGAAALAARHHDADVEPPRISDSQKPDVTTETSPATISKSPVPGQSASAAAAVADGATDTPTTEIPKSTAPVELSEGATTEYAPIRTNAPAPGVSSSAAAALSDGTEDPTLADEPAVKMMRQNEGINGSSAPNTASTTVPAKEISTPALHTTAPATSDLTSTAPVHDATTTDSTSSKALDPAMTSLGSGVPGPDTTVHDATTTNPILAAEVPATATGVLASSADSTAPVHDETTMVKDSTSTAPVHEPTSAAVTSNTADPTSTQAVNSNLANKDPSAVVAAAGVPSLTSAGTEVPKAGGNKDTEPSTSAPPETKTSAAPAAGERTTGAESTQAGTSSTPAKKTTPPQSSTANSSLGRADSTNTDRRKKRHRISAFFHKIFD